MNVPSGARLANLLLGVLLLASCSGTAEGPAISPTRATGPPVQLGQAIERVRTYALRIEKDVLAPNIPTYTPPYTPFRVLTTDPSPPSPPCPNAGQIAKTEYYFSGESADKYYAAVRTWLATNGFQVAEDTIESQQTATEAVTVDGFAVSMSLTFSWDLDLTFTSPCILPVTPKPQAVAEAPTLRQACLSPAQYVVSPKAPPYRGPGLHPVAVETLLPGNTAAADAYTPTAWNPALDDSDKVDKRRVQLIACVTGSPTGGSQPITCQYDRPQPKTLTLQLREATYAVVVRTARTGQKVSTFTVRGTQSNADSCPFSLSYDASTEVLRGIDLDIFEAKLHPLVTARR